MHFPKDPVMLLSVVNTKLRDYYPSLDVLCEDTQEEKQIIVEALKKIDYEYDGKRNQFVKKG